MKNEAQPFFARQAWVAGAWARDVLLGVSSDGHWNRVEPHCTAAEQARAIQLAGRCCPVSSMRTAMPFSVPSSV